MVLMRPLARGLLALSLVGVSVLHTDDLRACGGSIEGPVYVNRRNPDLPLDRVFAGRPGVIGPWSRSFQVLAWRALADAPFDAAERAAFVARERSLHRDTPAATVDGTVPVEGPTGASNDAALGGYAPDDEPWRAARATVTGSRGPNIANGWSTDGGWTPNCLADAFRSAADALRDRAARDGDRSDALRNWVDAQDAVFSNCGPTPGRSPIPLQESAPPEHRRDRAYQIAAAHFYAGRYDAAERDFAAIAADAASPWAPVARYLVLRSITRAAQRGRETPDAAGLARASQLARTLLADPNGAAVHDMTRRYEAWIDALRDPGARLHALGAGLGRPGTADHLAGDLQDYLHLYATRALPAARERPDDADPMTTWIAVRDEETRSASGRTLALALLQRTHAWQWVVAALQSEGDARDPRLDPALEAARTIGRDDPAFATARYERLRVLVERGRPAYEEIVRTADELTADDGPSARNLFRELAVRASRSVDELVPYAYGRPAGWLPETGLVQPADPTLGDDFSPAASSVLSLRTPVAVLVRAAAHRSLPAPLRARIANVALHRAALLGDEAAFQAAAALAVRLPGATARTVGALAQSPGGDARSLALLRSLLEGDGALTLGTAMIDSRDETGNHWSTRCERGSAAAPAWFLTPAERTAFAREQARWIALGDAITWAAAEAARLAPRMIAEPALPALLAAAVRNTRYNGCPAAAPIHRASRAAFTALHRHFPRSPEARATRYWY